MAESNTADEEISEIRITDKYTLRLLANYRRRNPQEVEGTTTKTATRLIVERLSELAADDKQRTGRTRRSETSRVRQPT